MPIQEVSDAINRVVDYEERDSSSRSHECGGGEVTLVVEHGVVLSEWVVIIGHVKNADPENPPGEISD